MLGTKKQMLKGKIMGHCFINGLSNNNQSKAFICEMSVSNFLQESILPFNPNLGFEMAFRLCWFLVCIRC